MTSEDRWTYPADEDTSRDIDREQADPDTVARKREARQVSHDQPAEREQGTSADSPGVDPSDRHRAE
jgi:hypothetical protein